MGNSRYDASPRPQRERERARDQSREYDSRYQRDRRDDVHRRRHTSRDQYESRYHRQRSHSGSPRSPPAGTRKRSRRNSRSRSPVRKARNALPSQVESFRRGADQPGGALPPKQKPNFKPTGLLAKEANTIAGTTTVLKYHEPAEARKPHPNQQWRMYVFKDQDVLDTIQLFQRSCWLIGRDQNVTDIFVEHPSISKQHAVIQFRFLTTSNEFGDKINRVKPYLIDLESANGTRLNNKRVNESRYVELVDGDVVSFGDSEREYVMMLPAPDKKA